jgi:hypothetical protein
MTTGPTDELNHFEAAILSMCGAIPNWPTLAHEFGLLDFTEHDGRSYCRSDAGRAALKAYNAKYRTVEVEAVSALVEFAEGELKATDELYAGYAEKLARHDYLRDAIAKVKDALR